MVRREFGKAAPKKTLPKNASVINYVVRCEKRENFGMPMRSHNLVIRQSHVKVPLILIHRRILPGANRIKPVLAFRQDDGMAFFSNSHSR